MRQNLNLHIGYHKTGTTSLQKVLASRDSAFNYLGRRYDNTDIDKEIAALARAVSLNDIESIVRIGKFVSEAIKEHGFDNNLISHENFLRPSALCFKGLNKLIELFQREFTVRVFVSTRQKNELILSRFTHDLMRLGFLTRFRLVPFFLRKRMLVNAICNDFECIYPYCNEEGLKCNCGLVKKIPLSFYEKETIKRNIDVHVNFVDILNNGSPDLVFGEDVFPLPKMNAAQQVYSEGQKAVLLKLIDDYLAR